jgi:hypothetical protein
MDEVTNGAPEVATPNAPATKQETPAPKVNKRGITNATRGASRLRFDNSDARPNGLFQAYIENIEVREITIGEDTSGMPSFNGLAIPKLVITFASTTEDPNKRKYAVLAFNAVESNVATIPGGKEEWKVTSVFGWIKHILDVYVLRGRELTDKEEALLSLSFDDTDENGEFSPVDSEQVIEGWKTLFTNFATMMNTLRDGGPVYKTKEGKIIPIWLKLLRYTKTGKGWKPVNKGDLAVPSFVGEGCIEIFKQNQNPVIRVDVIRENIHVMNLESDKKPNMPVAGMGSAPGFGGGVPVSDIPMGMGTGVDEINEDMPF